MIRCVLAIDSGTTAVKAAVVDVEGIIRGTGVGQIETLLGAGGAAEQDPSQLWDAVLQASRSALKGARGDDCSIVGVACSSQYSSVIPIGFDGEASGNLVLWRDTRGAKEVRVIAKDAE